MVKLQDLKYSEYNPRQIKRKAYQDLSESIIKFGVIDPLVVNNHPGRENVVIGGHQRLKILKKLNYVKVPVVYVNLAIEQEQELNLRLNKNTGEWDWDLLANLNSNLLFDVGFTKNELDIKLDLNFDKKDRIKEKQLEKCPKCGFDLINKKDT